MSQAKEPSVIPVKEAVANARAFLGDLLGGEIFDPTLEEIELSEDDRYWNVTLSFKRLDGSIASVMTNGLHRLYRIIKVDAHTGQAVSMKIRELNTTI